MQYTQVEKDYRTALRCDWERFITRAGAFTGSEDSFHAVNSSLGFNLAKTVGPLIRDIEELERHASQRELLVGTLYRKTGDQEEVIDRLNSRTETQARRIKELEATYEPADLPEMP